MSADEMKVQLQLQPLSASFAPKTFSLRPTVKVRIDLVGSSGTASSVPRPDNGILPSPTLDRSPAHIISHGAYFSFKTSVSNSNSIRVNGYLLENHTHALRDGDRIEFGKASCVGYDDDYDSDGDYESWPVYSFSPDLSIQVHLTFPPRFDHRRAWTNVFAEPALYVPPSSVSSFSRSPPPSLPTTLALPRPAATSRAEIPPASGPVVPIGTDWDGIAQLLEELHQADPPIKKPSHTFDCHTQVNPASSSAPANAVSSPVRSPLGDKALPTFLYGAFVASQPSPSPDTPVPADTLTSSTSQRDMVPPLILSASCPPFPLIATSTKPKESSAAAGARASSSSGPSSTSVLTSVLSPVPGSACHDSTPALETSASLDTADASSNSPPPPATVSSNITAMATPASPDRTSSARLAVGRVRHAWLHARRVTSAIGLETAKVAVDRTRIAWLQARSALVSSVAPSASSVHASVSPTDNLRGVGTDNANAQRAARGSTYPRNELDNVAPQPPPPLYWLSAHQLHYINVLATSVAQHLSDFILRVPSQLALPHAYHFPQHPQPHPHSYRIFPFSPLLAPLHFH